MFRTVFFLYFVLALILSACGGIRFLPYGEETPTIPISVNPRGMDTPFMPSPTAGEVVESSLPTEVPSTPSPTVPEPTAVSATSEPEPLVLEERMPFRLQEGSPAWLPNFSHPEEGCDWLGVAGQVFDGSGNPVTALVLEVGGELRGIQVQSLSLTGVAPAYGAGGYELYLGDQAIDSNSALWLQLKDISGKELSERVFFDTFSDCNRNLVLINFVESSFEIEVIEYFFPVFYNGLSGPVRTSSENDDSGEGSPLSEFYLPIFYNRFSPESSTTPSP